MEGISALILYMDGDNYEFFCTNQTKKGKSEREPKKGEDTQHLEAHVDHHGNKNIF
jgi:hypothetical protein